MVMLMNNATRGYALRFSNFFFWYLRLRSWCALRRRFVCALIVVPVAGRLLEAGRGLETLV